MIRFKSAFKAIYRYRLYTLINIVGLGLSLASVIFLSRYIYSELTVGHFNSQIDRLAAFVIEFEPASSGTKAPFLDDPTFYDNIPELLNPLSDPAIEAYTCTICLAKDNIYDGANNINVSTLVADSNFLKVFEYQLSRGNRESVLKSNSGVLVTKQFADRILPKEDPIGKKFYYGGQNSQLVIEGIIAEPSTKALCDFDIVIPRSVQKEWPIKPQGYAKLAHKNYLQSFNETHNQFFESSDWGCKIRYQFRPVKELYFDNAVIPKIESYNRGDRQTLYVLSIVTILILIIGVFNFININIVLTRHRGREANIKYIFGASRTIIGGGLYLENLIMVSASIIVGWMLVAIFSDVISTKAGICICSNMSFNIIFTLMLLILLPIICSLYFIFSRYRVGFRDVNKGRSFVMSSVFFVIQYVITIFIIINSIYLIKQLQFMTEQSPGYTTQNIIAVSYDSQMYGDPDDQKQFMAYLQRENSRWQVIAQTLDENPHIIKWSCGALPTNMSMAKFNFYNNDVVISDVAIAYVPERYLDLFDINLLQGRFFKVDTDRPRSNALVVNESFIKLLNISSWRDAIIKSNRSVVSGVDNQGVTEFSYFIIGVIPDIQTEHLRFAKKPIALVFNGAGTKTRWNEYLLIKGSNSPQGMQSVIKSMDSLFTKDFNIEFKYRLMDDVISDLYLHDRQSAYIFTIFAIIAIIISALGLFSLSMYDIGRRYREIAIRRVNGATIMDIFMLFISKYLILIGLAFVVGSILAYYVISLYVSDFAIRAPISWWIFAFSFIMTLLTSFCALVPQIIHGARINPIFGLKKQ